MSDHISDDQLAARWAPTLHRQEVAESEAFTFSPANEFWEENDAAATPNAPHGESGVMVALYPDAGEQQLLAVPGGEPADELHVTLVYLGNIGAEMDEGDKNQLISTVAGWAALQQPITATINGHGIFATPQPVTYANVDAQALPAARQSLIEALAERGFSSPSTHGYTPHMTLDYAERRDIQVPVVQITFDDVHIRWGGEDFTLTLGPDEDDDEENENSPALAQVAKSAPVRSGSFTIGGLGTSTTFPVSDFPALYNTVTGLALTERPAQPEPVQDQPAAEALIEPGKAFVTEINGHTLITGPAHAGQKAALAEPSLDDIIASPMLWMHGRFVGGEEANRNGAFWSAGDLEMGRASVVNGPLNWLHEARHIIGSLTAADFVTPAGAGRSGSGVQQAATSLPHIAATAGIWRWIYPDEAYVINQASEQGHLWYSMECVSREVSCVGEGGCGHTVSYGEYMAGAACEHVTQRASTRRFKDPVFLGGAVIVPPTRPGWADADAQVMQTAGRLAEAAYEQAGQPDVSASQWEQLMAQLVRYAEIPARNRPNQRH